MLKITPVCAFTDNYIWTIEQAQNLVCVDPGDAAPILQFIQKNHLTLETILITHHHHDHTGGIAELIAYYPEVRVYGPKHIKGITDPVKGNDAIQTSVGTFHTWDISGHTQEHLGYLIKDHFFCGDTLFSAGCGRVFDGSIETLFHSMQKINTLPENTYLYPAHEYTLSNLKFARFLEPTNQNIQAAITYAETHKCTLPTTLQKERLINPFLRTKEINFLEQIKKNTLYPTNSSLDLFSALREAKNQF